MALGPILTTDRLELKPPGPDDFDAFAGLLADPTAMAFIGGSMSRPVAWRQFTQNLGQWVAAGYGFFLVFERASGRLVGRVGTHMPVGWPGTEVGWALHGFAQGRGYATEAAGRAMDWAVDELGWTEVIHCIDPENAPSMAVARRLGSRVMREAMLPEPISHMCVVWGQGADEWRARRTGAN